LSWLASFQRHPTSIINTGSPTTQEMPAPPSQTAPPGQQGSGGLLNQLQKGIPTLPSGPGAAPGSQPPTGPQVPQSK
jgi:preprotein translocase subunit SecG